MRLQSVPDVKTLLDRAFKRSQKVRSSAADRLDKARDEELGRIAAIKDTVCGALDKVVKGIPRLEKLHPICAAAVDVDPGLDAFKRDLASISWASGKSRSLATDYSRQIRYCEHPKEMTRLRREFSGRLTSIVDKLDGPLDTARRAVKTLRSLPDLSQGEATVVVAGLPNVGKSRLVGALSTAAPEVAEYPFTTKRITLGHMEREGRVIQILDIPGLLDRPEGERNDIERLAVAAIRTAPDLIVYLFDPSETCGYDLASQRGLREDLAGLTAAPVIEASGKSDLAPPLPGMPAVSTETGDGVAELSDAIWGALKPRLDRMLAESLPHLLPSSMSKSPRRKGF